MSKLLITIYFLNVTCRLGADHKKAFAVETTRCVSEHNVFVMTSPFWHYRGVTLDLLIMLDFQPIKTGFVWESHMVVRLAAHLSARQKHDEYDTIF